ncbi:uncharacterized protein [Typha angustifolia]|uniref:uncharacterized protein n=1 Tax=Typha angustifolia TaxID=59011 RepID=UPI003C2F928B
MSLMSIFRWPESMPSSIPQWPELDFSCLAPGWRRLDLDLSVDCVLWTFVTALESIALVAMLCCFYVSCGCTL